MLGKLECFLGCHKWVSGHPNYPVLRQCKYCYRTQALDVWQKWIDIKFEENYTEKQIDEAIKLLDKIK